MITCLQGARNAAKERTVLCVCCTHVFSSSSTLALVTILIMTELLKMINYDSFFKNFIEADSPFTRNISIKRGKMTHCQVMEHELCLVKDADQLRGNREADHRLCFRFICYTILLLP